MIERLHQNAAGRAHDSIYCLERNIVNTWIFNYRHKNLHDDFTGTAGCPAKLCDKEGYRNWNSGSWVEQLSCGRCPVMILAIENARERLITYQGYQEGFDAIVPIHDKVGEVLLVHQIQKPLDL